MTIKCSSCGQEWPRDPALEVQCPVCRAAAGVECLRPSGHRVYGGELHPDRDRLAMEVVPGYGHCPAAAKPNRTPDGWVQPALFAETPGLSLSKPGSETEPTAICFVCNWPVLVAEAHRCHEEACPGETACQCNLLAHPRCCPLCAQARSERLRMAFHARGEPLPPARSPHRALWNAASSSGE